MPYDRLRHELWPHHGKYIRCLGTVYRIQAPPDGDDRYILRDYFRPNLPEMQKTTEEIAYMLSVQGGVLIEESRFIHKVDPI